MIILKISMFIFMSFRNKNEKKCHESKIYRFASLLAHCYVLKFPRANLVNQERQCRYHKSEIKEIIPGIMTCPILIFNNSLG